MRIAVFPGSFDPVTIGHQDIIARASKLFDRVYVSIVPNGTKTHPMFTDEQKLALMRASVEEFPNVEAELGDTFYVTMGMDSCLSIYSDASWARFTEKFESLPYTKTKAMRPLFANAAKCEPDAQGRIVLPQKLRAYAHLEKDVVVIGVSNRAEIWNAEKWAEIEAEELNPENLAAVMEELGF